MYPPLAPVPSKENNSRFTGPARLNIALAYGLGLLPGKEETWVMALFPCTVYAFCIRESMNKKYRSNLEANLSHSLQQHNMSVTRVKV